MMEHISYQVAEYDKAGRFVAVVSGAGKNRGTWDSTHSRSTAYRVARQMRAANPGKLYRVLRTNID